MFTNIGGKIKGLAVFLCWAGIIVSILVGFIQLAKGSSLGKYGGTMVVSGLLTAVIGSLLSWIGSFLLYGFGQLVENSDELVRRMNVEEPTPSSVSGKGMIWYCEGCGKPVDEYPCKFCGYGSSACASTNTQPKTIGHCELCDRHGVVVEFCEINDEMGRRFRNLCVECREKTGAFPKKN